MARSYGATVNFNERNAADQDGDPYGACDHFRRKITGPPVRTALDYIVHLHELGHIMDFGLTEGTLGEAKAWAFASAHADPEIMATMTETAWVAVGRFFTSYMR